MRGRLVAALAAIHAREAFEAAAPADVAEAGIAQADRRQLAQRRELGEQCQHAIVHLFQPDAHGGQSRHRRKRPESTVAEVRADSPPEPLERPGATERLEALIRRGRFLRAQFAQPRNRREVLHRHIVAQPAVGAE